MKRKEVWLGFVLFALVVAACAPLGRTVGRYASNGERMPMPSHCDGHWPLPAPAPTGVSATAVEALAVG